LANALLKKHLLSFCNRILGTSLMMQ